jgi:pyruvate ferredoxin oxidoreductase gamma subunit
VFTLELTSRTAELLGRGFALSAPLGAAACALVGLAPFDLVARAVREELAGFHLDARAIEHNIEAARLAYESLPAVKLRTRPPEAALAALYTPAYGPVGQGAPVIHAAGNSPARHTGSWRIFRPVIDRDACTRCGICFALWPDAAIGLDAAAYPVIDYDNCKGCMMCYQECPVRCIHEEREVRAW